MHRYAAPTAMGVSSRKQTASLRMLRWSSEKGRARSH